MLTVFAFLTSWPGRVGAGAGAAGAVGAASKIFSGAGAA
jgi:hypothetical protein